MLYQSDTLYLQDMLYYIDMRYLAWANPLTAAEDLHCVIMELRLKKKSLYTSSYLNARTKGGFIENELVPKC